jgi:hypothetical protein
MTTTNDITLPVAIWVPATDGVGGLFEVDYGTEGHPNVAFIAMFPALDDEEFEDQKLFVEQGTGNHYTAKELGEAYGDIAWKADIGTAGEIEGQYAPYKTENQRIAEEALDNAKYQLRAAKKALTAAQHEGAVNNAKKAKAAAEAAVTQAQLFVVQVNAVTDQFMEARR